MVEGVVEETGGSLWHDCLAAEHVAMRVTARKDLVLRLVARDSVLEMMDEIQHSLLSARALDHRTTILLAAARRARNCVTVSNADPKVLGRKTTSQGLRICLPDIMGMKKIVDVSQAEWIIVPCAATSIWLRRSVAWMLVLLAKESWVDGALIDTSLRWPRLREIDNAGRGADDGLKWGATWSCSIRTNLG